MTLPLLVLNMYGSSRQDRAHFLRFSAVSRSSEGGVPGQHRPLRRHLAEEHAAGQGERGGRHTMATMLTSPVSDPGILWFRSSLQPKSLATLLILNI